MSLQTITARELGEMDFGEKDLVMKYDHKSRTFDIYAYGLNVDPYSIERSRIDNPLKLLHWCCHLAGKRWMSKHDLKRFIHLVNTKLKMGAETYET